MRFKTTSLLVLFSISVMLVSCDKNDSPNNNPDGNGVDLTKARIEQFRFSELDNLPTTIEHPILNENGVETQMGTIRITLPANDTNWELTPLLSNFQVDDFSIEPGLGIKTNSQGGGLLYTIRSTKVRSRTVRYQLVLNRAVPEALNLSGFYFPKSSNPALPEDIHATSIVENPASMSYIYIFVPGGTDLQSLTGLVEHNGNSLVYTQDENSVPAQSTTSYPAAGLAMDLKYPKPFFLSVKRGAEVKTYNVIVDVEDPLHFSAQTVRLADLKQGTNHFVTIGELENKGNHPISINEITHSETIPANFTVIRGSVAIPSGGLLPGAKVAAKATVNGTIAPVGEYTTTAHFKPFIFQQAVTAEFLQPASMKITAEIIE